MAKYDAAGDKIPARSKLPVLWIIFIVIGAVLLTIGIVLAKKNGIEHYFSTVDVNESFAADDISAIDIEYAAGNINIEPSNDNYIYVKGTNIPDVYTFSVDGDTFEVTPKAELSVMGVNGINFGFNSDTIGELTIYLPEKTYRKFSFDIGAGDNEISGLICKNGEFDLGAGNCTISDCTFENYLDIDMGVGNAYILDCTAGGIDADLGVGDFSFSGTVNGDIKADCGVGDCKFSLTNPESDFSFDGDYTPKNRKNKKRSSNALYTIDIDSGIGSVDINFGE